MIPVKLVMENFISHMCSEIDFTQFSMALIIGTSDGNTKIANGVGKTSIFDAIRFALYGKVKFNKKEKVIKHGKSKCRVEFIFSLDGDIYKIERSMNKKTGLIDVSFYKKEDEEWKSEGFTCDTPTFTNSKIESLIKMSHDTFVNCIYFRQNDISGFAGAKPSKRKEILKEVLQIGFWDELQEISKKYEKTLIDKCANIRDKLELLGNLDIQYGVIQDKLKITKDKLQCFKSRISELELLINNSDEKINKLTVISNSLKIDDLNNSLKEISKKSLDLKNKRDSIKKEVQKNNEEISNAYNDCKLLDNKLLKLAEKVLIVEHPNRSKAETILRKFGIDQIPVITFTRNDLILKKSEKDNFYRNIDLLKSQFKQLISLQPGKECPICLSNIENIDNVIERREIKQKFLQDQIIELEKNIKEIENIINNEELSISKANEAVVEIERIELIIAKRMAVISNTTEKNNNLKEKFSILVNERQDLKEEKEKILSIINTLTDSNKDELESLIKQRDILNLELNTLRENVINSSVQLGYLEANLEEIERKISEKQTLLIQKETLISEINVYSEVSKAFGKDGIQAIIMENITEDLRNYTNSILKNICNEPMTVDFVTQKQTGIGTWKEDFNISIMIGNNEMDFEDLSGGEQVRISIALRLALSKLLMQRIGSNIKFLLLDEIDQTLDSQGVDILAESIINLSREFKIMLITHNETMKEKFEHIITVSKGSAGSIIRQ